MTTLSPSGFLRIGASDLEYRMIGPAPADAPTIIMLHEGLGSAALWGDFPDKLQAATGFGVFAYSRAGYGASSPVPLPRPLDYMHVEALEVLPRLLDTIGFRRGLLLGHSDGASIATIYAGGIQDHRVRGVVLIAPHFIVEDISVASIAEIRKAYETTDLKSKLQRWHSDVDNALDPNIGYYTLLGSRLVGDGVDVRYVVTAAEQSSMAVVDIGDNGSARDHFSGERTDGGFDEMRLHADE